MDDWSIMASVEHTSTVSQVESVERAQGVRTTLLFPTPLWKQIKHAAVDDNKTAQQFVIDGMAEFLKQRAAQMEAA